MIGGHEFVLYDVETGEGRNAFDHERLAAALSAATGADYSPVRLPFDDFRYVDDLEGIVVSFEGSAWRCDLSDYSCAEEEPSAASGPESRPRSFGVVRGLEVPADTTPLPSPDGRWEALIHNHNLAVRPAGGGELTVLSSDGSEGNFSRTAPGASPATPPCSTRNPATSWTSSSR